MRPLSVLAVLFLLLFLAPIRPAEGAPKAWTILIYMDADNDLEAEGITDFAEIASVGSQPQVDILVQMDRAENYTTAEGDWTSARRFFVSRGMTPASPEIADLGEVNMADPANLTNFVNWGIQNYPADHYFLVLWDHGLGWQGVVVDESHTSNDCGIARPDCLTARELRAAMESIVATNGRRIDLVGNDACRMTLEIDYELAPFVDYLVGSEKDEPLEGWPYDTLLQAVAATPTMSPPEMATVLVDRYVESYTNNSLYSVSLSAIDARMLRPFASSFDAFLGELGEHQPYFAAEVTAARSATERYEGGGDYDLYHFLENLIARIPSRELERSADNLFSAFDAAVVHENHWDHPNPQNGVHAVNAHGMSLYFPTIGGGGLEYERLALSQDTRWDEFLRSYANGSRPQIAANATASSADSDGDGLLDEIVLRYAPAINGTMRVDLYADGKYGSSREYPAVASRADEVRVPALVGGYYEISFYLLEGEALKNLTIVRELIVQERVHFRGEVRGQDGRPLVGASVTLVHVPTGNRTAVVTGDAGNYSIAVVYPTWFREGDPMRLEAFAGDQRATVTFPATIGPDRAVVRDIGLNTVGLAGWYVALAALAILAAIGLLGTFYYWRRLHRFKEIP